MNLIADNVLGLIEDNDMDREFLISVIGSDDEEFDMWMSGESPISHKNAKMISNMLGCSIEDIVKKERILTSSSSFHPIHRLHELMEEHGTTRRELQAGTGLPSGSISDYVSKGVASARISSAQAIADYYGVTLDYLAGITDDKTKSFLEEESQIQTLKKRIEEVELMISNIKRMVDSL